MKWAGCQRKRAGGSTLLNWPRQITVFYNYRILYAIMYYNYVCQIVSRPTCVRMCYVCGISTVSVHVVT